MPLIYKSLGVIETPNNSNDAVLTGWMDLHLELSEFYGKNIRQGNSVKIDGMQLAVVPHDSGAEDDYDVGGAVTGIFNYCPTTKHSKKAWNDAFKKWKTQSKFSSVQSPRTINNDFELGYNASYTNSRTSTLVKHHGDSGHEKVVIFGDTTDGTDWCLQDYYNSTHRTMPLPEDHYNDGNLKTNKFSGTKFPNSQKIFMGATSSSIVTDIESLATPDTMYSGGVSMQDFTTFPQPAEVLCGLVQYGIFWHPPDTLSQMEDNLELYVVFSVKSWKPLVYRRRRRKSRGYRGKWTRRTGRGKSRRRRYRR